MRANNGRLTKVLIGVAITVIAAMVLGGVHLYGDVRVHEVRGAQHERRIGGIEAEQDVLQKDVSDIKADIREIKTILQRMEKGTAR